MAATVLSTIMQSLFLSAVFFSLIFLGFSSAFGAALGFVWVDIVKPQQLAYAIITGWPLSFIAALIMLAQYLIKDKKSPPPYGILLILITALGAWMTFTTMISPLPGGSAWEKWDWAFKVIVFAVFVPYVFRSRIQIEAFILVFLFSASTIFCSAGVKTLLGSGGYGTLAIMGMGNTGLAEGSTLAVVCVMLIPLTIHLMRHSIIFPKRWYTTCLFLGIIVTALATVIGTSARTGLIAVGVLVILSLLKTKRKMLWIAGLATAGTIIMNIDLSNTSWGNRMSTVETYNSDSSALGRIEVWKWTIGFVAENPWGGGFDSFRLNRIANVTNDGIIQYYPEGKIAGKAFHSVYFELLGEQGIVGFAMYFAMIGIALLKLRKLRNQWRDHAGMAWLTDLADALGKSILIFLAGGAFVGIAYQPFIFYMISLVITIEAYAQRAVREEMPENKIGRVTT